MKIRYHPITFDKIQIRNPIECFNCGKRISDKVDKCPRCGAKNEIIKDNPFVVYERGA